MHRTSTAQDLADELRDLVDAVSPSIESAAHAVVEKTPPLIEKSRTLTREKGAQLAGALADRIPDPVVDRLPDAVSDRLPSHGHGKRRKLLLLAGLGAVGAAVFVAIRRSQVPPPQHEPRATTYPRAAEPPAEPDPQDRPE
ncbi:hypothetical protein GUY44_07260 [Pimelobacter simplex]|uniref:Uncharacterized protein n=1 Tax=Nocardioides simplex TaxID=2045 RepID=A0A0A1DML2_NOCSI|nr:hypothetical protein [Pimelobacter simplex]AIY17798.1 hypothetical protein KR76_15350 [Pimelobacter simplex]MCG8150271.1 hypothetical protein [Pimelobacter simplex]GEB13519.1 hypothetical protein NSI01_18340 [Pimelobacter simplex]SFM72364.1 hypothetical protein SAMN05421671_3152 [Pimelobacter simplex]